jgi:hypothetical protein
MKNKNKIYEVEIKSQSLLREGKKGFITYFQGGPKKKIVSNVQKMFPQFTNPKDKPMVNITPISFKEYQLRVDGEPIKQKGHLITMKEHIL